MEKTKKGLRINRFLISIIILLGLILVAPPAFAWGPMRDTYTCQDIDNMYDNDAWPKDKIVFNSITDTPNFGDERAFVGAREYNNDDKGFENTWNNTSIDVKDGQEYILRLFVHNNSPWGREGIAENVRASFSIPYIFSKSVNVSGFIYADNAETVWDSITFQSNRTFRLEYVDGSAILGNSGIGNPANGKTTNPLGYKLSDEVVTKSGGTLIGYDDINGEIPGGHEYACYITIRVKAVFNDDLILSSSVRLSEHFNNSWKNTINANAGDKIDIQIQYKNMSDAVQKDVAMRVVLPDGLHFVEDSGQIINSSHPDGAPLEGLHIVTNGIAIGNYDPNASARIIFTVEVTDDALSETNDTLISLFQVGVGSLSEQDRPFIMQDSTEVVIGEKSIESYTVVIGLIGIVMGCLFLILMLHRTIQKRP